MSISVARVGRETLGILVKPCLSPTYSAVAISCKECSDILSISRFYGFLCEVFPFALGMNCYMMEANVRSLKGRPNSHYNEDPSVRILCMPLQINHGLSITYVPLMCHLIPSEYEDLVETVNTYNKILPSSSISRNRGEPSVFNYTHNIQTVYTNR